MSNRDTICDLVRINLNRIDDDSSSHDLLMADIATVANNRYRQLFEKRLWPETMEFAIEDTIVADRQEVPLPDELSLITRIVIGDVELKAQDGARQSDYEYYFTQRGCQGVWLHKAFTSDQDALFDGKCVFSELSAKDEPIFDCSTILVNIVTADFLRLDETDHARAVDFVNEANQAYNQLVERYESQMANEKRVIPAAPFTDLREFSWNQPGSTSTVF